MTFYLLHSHDQYNDDMEVKGFSTCKELVDFIALKRPAWTIVFEGELIDNLTTRGINDDDLPHAQVPH